MEFYPYEIDTEVTIRDVGKYKYLCLTLPENLARDLPFDTYPRLRVHGEIAGYDFEAAWQPQKNGPYWMMIPKDILKAADLSIGDTVHVAFGISDQDAVHVPPELAEALQEAGLSAEWEALSPGKRRGFCYLVDRAKAPATKQKRIADIFDQLGV